MPDKNEMIVALFDEIEEGNRDATNEYLIEAVAAAADVDLDDVESAVADRLRDRL